MKILEYQKYYKKHNQSSWYAKKCVCLLIGFLLANAQIVEFPVVYCSEEFSKLLGFPRSEVMQNSIRNDFMVGALTDRTTIGKYIVLIMLVV